MKTANDLVIYEVLIKQNLRAFLDVSALVSWLLVEGNEYAGYEGVKEEKKNQ